MTVEQYWSADPYLAVVYRKRKDIENEEHNYWLWLQGVYYYEAVATALANAFRGKGKAPIKYVQKPYEIFAPRKSDAELRKERAKDAIRKLNLFKEAWDRKQENG